MAKKGNRQHRLVGYPAFDIERPPEIRLLNSTAMKAAWNDPHDDKPSAARTVREVAGYRQFCPLRWSIRRHGARSSFTAEHVAAADALRLRYDGSRLGFSGLKDWRPVHSTQFRPSTGPTNTAKRQLRARVEFDRVWRLFNDQQRAALVAVVLRNMSIARTCEFFDWPKAKLLAVLLPALDELVRHFDDDIRSGRLVVEAAA
jgi:hypothetical protein